jgi:hypothetical protein
MIHIDRVMHIKSLACTCTSDAISSLAKRHAGMTTAASRDENVVSKSKNLKLKWLSFGQVGPIDFQLFMSYSCHRYDTMVVFVFETKQNR